MKKQLVVLAAGMGSRYGGLKQMDPVGPDGEFIPDYSIFDAVKAGFSEIVFVIRHDLEKDFRRIVGSRWERKMPVRYAFQELSDIPAGFAVPPDRKKPWGTGHAILAARGIIDAPFAMVNADDFYGRSGFKALADFLDKTASDDSRYAMVAYDVAKTLSENGSVSRGVCDVTPAGDLASVVEALVIERGPDGAIRADGKVVPEDTPVSMNLWGFKPGFVKHLAEQFAGFLREKVDVPKSEFFVPSVVENLVAARKASVRVLRTDSTWFGVTNAADRPGVVAHFAALKKSGAYPGNFMK